MTVIESAGSAQRSKNLLRPESLDDVIGQEQAKYLLKRACQGCFLRVQPLDHVLLVGESGKGKTTFAHTVANELGVEVYQLEAPVGMDTLLELRTTMRHGQILFLDEIHQQAVMERRGKQASAQPEALFSLMEDRVIPTQQGMLPFPEITLMGATTDEGMLPDAFVNRFPLRPRLVDYTRPELEAIAWMNASKLGIEISPQAIRLFAGACRGVPREINNLMKNAAILATVDGECSTRDAEEVLEINGITEDGLTPDMQLMLTFLYERARQETKDGEVRHQASVGTIATALGKSRDQKVIALRVEPFLIKRGFVQVTHGGRRLTDAGLKRARELLA